jgi:hypothetical protein
MRFPLEDLTGVLWCLRATAVPFALSSATTLFVALSLASLQQQSRLRKIALGLVWAHLLPVLFVPILIAQVVTSQAETFLSLEIRRSVLLLSLFGFVFHTFLAYQILTRVLQWDLRIEKLKYFLLNGTQRPFRIRLALICVELAPSLLFSFMLIFIFQESMVSAPYFMDIKTVMSYTQEALQALDIVRGSELVGLIAIGITLSLAVSWYIPTFLGRVLLRRLVRGHHRNPSGLPISRLAFKPFFIFFGAGLISATLHIAVVLLAVWGTFKAANERPGTQSERLRDIALTILSPACLAGFAGCLLFLCLVVCWRSFLRDRSYEDHANPPDHLQLLAFFPPSLLGIVGLLAVQDPKSKLVIGLGILLAYGFSLMAFLANRETLGKSALMLFNARGVRLRGLWRSAVFLASEVGGIILPVVLVLYFEWIEDGIQVMIFPGKGFASKLRGLKFGGLPVPVYQGAFLFFSFWIVMASLALIFSKVRFTLASLLLRSTSRARSGHRIKIFMLLIGLASFCPTAKAEYSSPKVPMGEKENGNYVKVGGTCVYSEIFFRSGDLFRIKDAKECKNVEIARVVVESNNSVGIEVEGILSVLRVRILEFKSTRSLFHITGAGKNSMVSTLDVDRVDVALQASSMERPGISFDNVTIGRLAIAGDNASWKGSSPKSVDITMGEGSRVSEVNIQRLDAPSIVLRIIQGESASVMLDEVVTSHLEIKGAESGQVRSGGVEIDANVQLRPISPEEAAMLAVSDLGLRGAVLNLDAAERVGEPQIAVLEMARVELMSPDSTVRVSVGEREESGKEIHLSVRLTEVRNRGRIEISGKTLRELTLAQISSESLRDLATVVVVSNRIDRVNLVGVGLTEVSICGRDRDEVNRPQALRLSNLNIVGEVVVPGVFVEGIGQFVDNPISRAELFRLLQSRGVYCGSRTPIGLDALYLRKKQELTAVSKPVAWAMDQATGFGVRPANAFRTLLIMLGLHLVLRFLFLARSAIKDKQPLWAAIKRGGCQSLQGLLLGRDHSADESLPALLLCRGVFGILFYAQITACSVYFSQTTLQ